MHVTNTKEAIVNALAWGWTRKGTQLETYLTYLCSIDKSGISSDTRNEQGLEAGYILAAIDSQKPHIAEWINYCYGPQEDSIRLSSLAYKLRCLKFPIGTPKKHKRWYKLSTVAIQDVRMRQWLSRAMPQVVYCQELGIHEPNFKRDWSKKVEDLLDIIWGWDREGLATVSIMCKALRGSLEIDGKPAGPTDALNSIKSLQNDKFMDYNFPQSKVFPKRPNSASRPSP